jgi:Cu(I)/Ag(I) efflux system membrane fusion protein
MHPSIIRDNPKDKCPICFMPLSKYRIVLAGISTWPVQYKPVSKDISAVGYVEFDERAQRTVSARVAGRIDKLFANETGQVVREGDELALLYSPDLLVTVQNLLDAKRSNNKELLQGARTRLELLGIDQRQIDEILSSGKTAPTIKIRSPISGHVIRKYVKEGQYVEEGMPLYDVADISTVWIQAQIYEDDMPFLPPISENHVKANSDLEVTATTRAFPNETFHGKLAFIYPHVDQDTRTVTVRLELENPEHKLRPGSTANVTLKAKPSNVSALSAGSKDPKRHQMLTQGEVLAIPESSVIDTGTQKIVYRESLPGSYEGVEVKLGPRMTGLNNEILYPVLGGLKEGEKIVTSGSFLVDAETRLNPSAGSIYFGGSSGAHNAQPVSKVVRPSTPEDPDAKIHASLGKLSPEDRKLAEAQRFCPVLSGSRLGGMGVPVKLTIEGQPVFVCCSGCTKKATSNPEETLKTVSRLKQEHGTHKE